MNWNEKQQIKEEWGWGDGGRVGAMFNINPGVEGLQLCGLCRLGAESYFDTLNLAVFSAAYGQTGTQTSSSSWNQYYTIII